MKRYSFWDKLKYYFDNTMSRGSAALIIWLTIFSFLMIVGLSFITFIARFPNSFGERQSFVDFIWFGLLRTLDPGTMGEDDGSWGFKLMMLILTLGGIFIISTLIGIITTGIENKLDELRKGRSAVIETGHTIIFGWSEQIYTIIRELVFTNRNKRRSCIVILGNRDKVGMEDDIRDKIESTGKTKVVCRQGDPIDINDINIASPDTSKSIIIISPETDDPDSYVLKTLLAIVNNPHRRPEPYNIVLQLRDLKNAEVAKLIGKGEVEIILIGEMISKIIAQTCRQSGLSQVYGELLSFHGDEIYFHKTSELTGIKIREAMFRSSNSTLIGIKSPGLKPQLNPGSETVIEDGDELIFIAENYDSITIHNSARDKISPDLIRINKPSRLTSEKNAIIGWNWRVTSIVKELDNYVPPGSELVIISDKKDGELIIKEESDAFRNQTVRFIFGDTTDRRFLEKINPGQFDHIVILCYSDDLDPQKADAKTLVTLLHLRDIAEKSRFRFSIVSEMMDVRNRNLAEIARADDFIISNKLISQVISQISENKFLNQIFQELFSPVGWEIYLKPVSDYVLSGKEMNFYTVIEAGRQKNECVIGYRIMTYANDSSKGYGIKINPDKDKVLTFNESDRLIVIGKE